MNVVFLGLGGNMGDRLENLQKTAAALKSSCGNLVSSSSIYETEAWGSLSKNNYLNQVVELHTPLSAEMLLEKLLLIEKELGRERNGQQNSDRTADLDILLFNAEIINHKHIQIPHPRLHLRKFVLVPLYELAPLYVHPTLQKTVQDLLNNCSDSLAVKKFISC